MYKWLCYLPEDLSQRLWFQIIDGVVHFWNDAQRVSVVIQRALNVSYTTWSVKTSQRDFMRAGTYFCYVRLIQTRYHVRASAVWIHEKAMGTCSETRPPSSWQRPDDTRIRESCRANPSCFL